MNESDALEAACRAYIGTRQDGTHPWDDEATRNDTFARHLRVGMARALAAARNDQPDVAALTADDVLFIANNASRQTLVEAMIRLRGELDVALAANVRLRAKCDALQMVNDD